MGAPGKRLETRTDTNATLAPLGRTAPISAVRGTTPERLKPTLNGPIATLAARVRGVRDLIRQRTLEPGTQKSGRPCSCSASCHPPRSAARASKADAIRLPAFFPKK
jgi:hypothetical protein